MSLSLSNLKPAPGSKKKEKRVGRGNAAGGGTTAGRGTKGQKARTGGRNGLKRLGMRRMLLSFPKLGGFRSLYGRPAVVNLETLERIFVSGDTVSPKILLERGHVGTTKHGVKILGDGKLTKKLIVKDCKVSESARKKIVEVGGEIK